ncbi:MAG: hypothetical protein LBE30_06280 [Comamonas sp.]|jgi:uncharacterized protein|nr:hypothetical protein [Comamonas sp.]
MKYLLVMLVVAIAIGIWRGKRRVHGASSTSARPSTALNKPQSMVECAYCGLHLPQADAVTDAQGTQGRFYCSAEHRSLATQDPTGR